MTQMKPALCFEFLFYLLTYCLPKINHYNNDRVWKDYTHKVGSQNIDISSLTYTELYIIIVTQNNNFI